MNHRWPSDSLGDSHMTIKWPKLTIRWLSDNYLYKQIVNELEIGSHNFTLQNKQEIRGTEFVTDRIDPLAVPIDNGPDILSGDEYIYQLTLPFIFKVRLQGWISRSLLKSLIWADS